MLLILAIGAVAGGTAIFLGRYLPANVVRISELVGAGSIVALAVVGTISLMAAPRGSIPLKLAIAILVGGGLIVLGVSGVRESLRFWNDYSQPAPESYRVPSTGLDG